MLWERTVKRKARPAPDSGRPNVALHLLPSLAPILPGPGSSQAFQRPCALWIREKHHPGPGLVAERAWLSGLGTSWPALCGGKARGPLISGIIFSCDFQARHPFGPEDCTGAWFVPLLRGLGAGSEVGSSSYRSCHCGLEQDLCFQGLSICVPSPRPPVTQDRGKDLSETSFPLGPSQLPAPVCGQGSCSPCMWQVFSQYTVWIPMGIPLRFDLGHRLFSLGL